MTLSELIDKYAQKLCECDKGDELRVQMLVSFLQDLSIVHKSSERVGLKKNNVKQSTKEYAYRAGYMQARIDIQDELIHMLQSLEPDEEKYRYG